MMLAMPRVSLRLSDLLEIARSPAFRLRTPRFLIG
jgi:hypothetical protein